jgi:hypothetical protein
LAVTTGGNQFAVDDARFRREPEDRGSDRWEAARKVAAVPAEDLRGETVLVELHPIPIEFQLVEPTIAGRWRWSQLR